MAFSGNIEKRIGRFVVRSSPVIHGNTNVVNLERYQYPVTSPVDEGSVTLNVADFFVGIMQSLQSGDTTYVTPTAKEIVDQIVATRGSCKEGDGFEFSVVNESLSDYTITVSGGSSVTIVGSAEVAQLSSGTFLVRVGNAQSGSESVSLYRK